ncbi:hypothetical protein THASP1DRAFT_29169 [Thamnocephalis sphaerospora]|uniref:F-box domain-containing protein n=1 Tax=Thamnocephalis sphaerospora TaxID=78915 RepID=A0A4P9XUC5_9FUNG|nr:hypothetical protein THASP1DRAFT_29169 [Thamnocephalis sphaerospora]|eukprot:RKP09040.1 hypothetical protein THASP1DRAFT_29169 [Thamnocephalis sphaerospora]
MKRIPDEVLDHIVEICNDEAALVVLSCASKRLRSRVACRQEAWRKRFERQFLQSNDSEQKWLHQHMRAKRAATHLGDTTSILLFPQGSAQFDWFDAYCERRAVEYRWRHGKYAAHRLTNTANVRPRGVRLQSILCAFDYSPAGDVAVVSQWLIASPRQSAWFSEPLYWGDMDTEDVVVLSKRQSDEYLVIQAWNMLVDCYSLCVWHTAAPHRPPRTIITDKREIPDVSLRGSWLAHRIAHSADTGQYGAAFVYDLARGACYSDIQGNIHTCCSLNATTDRMRIVCVEYNKSTSSPVTIAYKLWQVAPDRAEPMQCQATGRKAMSLKQGDIKLQRIDDGKFILYSRETDDLDPISAPTISLVEVVDEASGVLLKEKWSLGIRVMDIRSIASHDLFSIQQTYDKWLLLSLIDGSEVRRVHFNCWICSGLYPPDDQWAKMIDDSMWWNPRDDPTLHIHEEASQELSPAAIVYGHDDAITVVDYTGCMHRSEHQQGVERLSIEIRNRRIAERKHLVAEDKRIAAKRKLLLPEGVRMRTEGAHLRDKSKRMREEGEHIFTESMRMRDEDSRVYDKGKRMFTESMQMRDEGRRLCDEGRRILDECEHLTAKLQEIRAQIRALDST